MTDAVSCWCVKKYTCCTKLHFIALAECTPFPQNMADTDWKRDLKAIVILTGIIGIVVVLSKMVSQAIPGIPMPAAAIMLTIPGVNFATIVLAMYKMVR